MQRSRSLLVLDIDDAGMAGKEPFECIEDLENGVVLEHEFSTQIGPCSRPVQWEPSDAIAQCDPVCGIALTVK